MNRKLNLNAIAVVTAVFSLHDAARVGFARAMIYEGFDYPAGVTFVNGLSGGTGWSGGYQAPPDQRVRIRPASWQHPTALPSVGGSLAVESSLGSWLGSSRNLTQPFELDQEVWISCLYRKEDFPGTLALNFADDVSQGARFVTSISGPGIGYANTSTAATGPLSWEFNTVVLMVMRLSPATDGQRQSQLWLNPGTLPLGPALLTTAIPAERVSRVYFGANFYTSLDEFRMGTSLSQVLIPSPAPTPALLALSALVARRRTRT